MATDAQQAMLFQIPDFDLLVDEGRKREDLTSYLFQDDSIIDVETKRLQYGEDLHSKPVSYDHFFSLTDLSDSFSDGSVTPSSSDGKEHRETPGDFYADDHWSQSGQGSARQIGLLSWEAFESQKDEESQTSYISEAGARVFDAILTHTEDAFDAHNQDCVITQTSIYVSSLVAMGLGRSSLFFQYNQERKTFVQTAKRAKVSGFVGETIVGCQALFTNCGNLVRSLQEYIETVYQQNLSSSKIAMADAISALLRILQTCLGRTSDSHATLLQIQVAFRPAEDLLLTFSHMVEISEPTDNDEAVLSCLFEEMKRMEHRSDRNCAIISEVLSHASQPFLSFSAEWLGISEECNNARMEKTGEGRGFVKIEDRVWLDEQGIETAQPDYVFDKGSVPSFIEAEDARTLFETGRSLRFLRTYHANHALAQANVVSLANPPSLSWAFSWARIAEVELQAAKYQRDLTAAIRQYSWPLPSKVRDDDASQKSRTCEELSYFGRPEEEVEGIFNAMIAATDRELFPITHVNRLSSLVVERLRTSVSDETDLDLISAVPITLLPSLSFSPVIAAQARIVNGATMRLFFKSHNLREHLSVQKRFQLLGDGVFSSRLSHALFDPELETAERQAGVARSGGIMGLRLGGRDSWPPATSELRLALMGVLTDCYSSHDQAETKRSGGFLNRGSSLPGDLSFSVRDMTNEEIAKCIDPDSVEALDFLRLSYKTPAPLDAVVTPLALYKYDQLFKLLLRVLRMLYSVGQLFRDATDRTSYWRGIDDCAQRFRIEAHHFVSNIAAYFFDVGISATWSLFERKLAETEARIDLDGGQAPLGPHEGLDALCNYHEKVLDRIMFSLLLRKRQGPVMKVLEEIFGMILVFAKYSRSKAMGLNRKVGQDDEVVDMYGKFRRKVVVFLDVCRGMTERKGFGERGNEETKGARKGLFDTSELVEENTIVQLLARLEMSGYY